MAKSHKWRERQKAYEAGQLHEWHTAQEAQPWGKAPDASPPVNPSAQSAWERAYSGAEVGPVGGSWPDDGRHIPYMRWRLPFNSAR